MYPFNHKMGQKIQTSAQGISVDRAFLAHLSIAATEAVAASANGIAVANLGVGVQTKTTGITNPAVPRALSIVANVAGVTGNVVISGKNYAGEAMSETIALNGITTVNGAKAFKEITSIGLPVQVHTPVAQIETATIVGTITTAGNVSVTITAAGMTGSPKTIAVAVALSDTAALIAGKIRTALAADTDVTAKYTVSGATDKVILTAIAPDVNDATLNIAIADGTSVGVTAAPSSANTTAGVPYDIVSVGWNDKLGLPYKLSHNTVLQTFVDNVLEGTAATVTTSATALESNTLDPNTSLSGKVVDTYLIV